MSTPWFPFYVGDYVRDTARLTTEGHGAYLLLMLDYWANGSPPDDDDTLASIAKLSLEHWLKLRPRVAPFFQMEGGRWLHGRIDRELSKANEKHQKRAEAGAAGGRAKAKNKQCSSNANSEPEALLYQPQPQPHSKKDSRVVAKKATPPRASSEPSRFDEFWLEYPRRLGANPRAPAEKKFNALVKSGVDAQMMIEAIKKLAIDERGKGNVGTAFIPQASTWLNQQRWADHAAVAFLKEQHDAPAQLESAVRMYAKSGRWSRFAGPEPGMGGCRASAELMAKHGMHPDGRKIQVEPA